LLEVYKENYESNNIEFSNYILDFLAQKPELDNVSVSIFLDDVIIYSKNQTPSEVNIRFYSSNNFLDQF